jgi:hypothetical protein
MIFALIILTHRRLEALERPGIATGKMEPLIAGREDDPGGLHTCNLRESSLFFHLIFSGFQISSVYFAILSSFCQTASARSRLIAFSNCSTSRSVPISGRELMVRILMSMVRMPGVSRYYLGLSVIWVRIWLWAWGGCGIVPTRPISIDVDIGIVAPAITGVLEDVPARNVSIEPSFVPTRGVDVACIISNEISLGRWVPFIEPDIA